MGSTTVSTLRAVASAAAMLLISCGPSAADRDQARSEKAEQRLAESEAGAEVLRAFAKEHGAEPVEFSSLVREFALSTTAVVQESVSGRRIALYAPIMDILKPSPDRFQVMIGLHGMSGAYLLLLLEIDEPDARALMEIPLADLVRGRTAIAAELADARAMHLELEGCGMDDCTSVDIVPIAYPRPLVITGRVVAIQSAQMATDTQ